jgi:quercetin dioxygenase-like cupin family protein
MTDRRLSVRPAEIVWRDQRALAPGAQFAVMLGDPGEAGPYVFRLRASAGHRAMPHTHPEERVYTVLSGTFYLGFGHRFDDGRLEPYPEGSVLIVREGRHHFQLARAGEYVVQVEGVGPTAVTYEDPTDDPRLPRGTSSNPTPS